MEDYNPKLICFSCNFGWGYLDEIKAFQTENQIPIACSGKLETRHILTALKEGADGVLILGCEDGHCHFQHGSFRTEKMVYLMQKVLPAFGIEPERVRIEMSHDPEGKKIPELVAEMKRDLAKLGPITRI
jgi:F420-non-reducing hydrogenase iron-sulfur subunit